MALQQRQSSMAKVATGERHAEIERDEIGHGRTFQAAN